MPHKNKKMVQTFETILNQIRITSKNKSDVGTKFEILIKNFFLVDKHYRDRFDKVWMWSEYPDRDGHDIGIDLVAKERDGGLCAIQCKCYADNGSLDMKKVATFLASAINYDNKILVYTGENITNNAEKILKRHSCKKIRKEDLEESSINWNSFPKLHTKQSLKLHDYQTDALQNVLDGFKKHDRGKLIMACGTGKTLVSLHISEKLIGVSGIILYLVPSISLIQQSMRSWSNNGNVKHRYMAVCSDGTVGEGGSITELESPATTNEHELRQFLNKKRDNSMTVIFSTYHSIKTVQKALFKKNVDLVICDEAHRTTGLEEKSYYTTIHDDKKICAKKRLYMTATPKIYSEKIMKSNEKKIYSMNDETKYGPEFHKLSFSDAVHKFKALSDFRIKIAIIPDELLNKKYHINLSTKEGMIPISEKTRMAAIWHGLLHPDDDESNENLLQRVIVFFNRIDKSEMFAGERLDPDDNDRSFSTIVKEYNNKIGRNNIKYNVEVQHIDGKDNSHYRRERMKWLTKSNDKPYTCRLLSNARCLSEGVDVPALDGVVFADPRQSVVDVVQSVGRVMRKFDGKKYGYVILPVAIPSHISPHEAFKNNGPFKVVWQVLNGLLSHDDSLAREINKLILDKTSTSDDGDGEDDGKKKKKPRISISVLDNYWEDKDTLTNVMIDQIKTKLVERVGDSHYYDKYGSHLGQVSKMVESHLRHNIKTSPTKKLDLTKIHHELKKLVNSSVTQDETIRIISQHVILSRVFDDLFSNEFISHNPISSVLDKMTKKIGIKNELKILEDVGFYEDVAKEVENITNNKARQNFIKTIYGNFFKSVSKKETEQHGVVYTPVEVIDFIINSTQHILKKEFNLEFNDRSVKVLEPFAGTGTFITRLLESKLITDNLYEKYRQDLFANEMILLAYYIATVNIETTFTFLRKNNKYVPFKGMSYTDTLRIDPQYREDVHHRQEQSVITETFKTAHERIMHQKSSHIHVIMGNPPYSSGQKSYDDNTPNLDYPNLDKRISKTYALKARTKRKSSLYDSYVRSLRWASDRIGESGIIAFVTSASFLRSESGAGIRATFVNEFDKIYCYDLRGNQNTQGETSRKEGGKIFGSGSKSPVVILILIKNPSKSNCKIYYRDIGDYLSRERKLEEIEKARSITGIKDWTTIQPDTHNDWLNIRNDEFNDYRVIGNEDTKSGKNKSSVFRTYARGVTTSRDPWAYNSNKDIVSKNMKRHIEYCLSQDFDNPIPNPTYAKFDEELFRNLKTSKTIIKFDKSKIRIALYRPFFKQYLYFDQVFNTRSSPIKTFFPKEDTDNLVVCVPYKTGSFSAFVTNITPDLNILKANQCFPLYTYKKINGKYVKQDNILDSTLNEYQVHYKNTNITKLDIFYYIYGILHHHDYGEKFKSNLMKEFPRIPMAPDFKAFTRLGKKLADLHINYDTVQEYNIEEKCKITKFNNISFGTRKTDTGKRIIDKTKLYVDKTLVFENIPIINYKINGRTPLEWIVDRYNYTINDVSGIINNSCENIDITSLTKQIIYVGIETDKLINNLPKKFEPDNWSPPKKGLDAFNDNMPDV